MIWLIIPFIAAIIGWVVAKHKDAYRKRYDDDFDARPRVVDRIVNAFIYLVVGSLIALVCFGIGSLGYDNSYARGNTKIVDAPIDIVSFADGGIDIHGRMFLGSGYINSEPVYTYYYEIDGDSGGVKQGNIEADITTIIQDDNHPPQIIQHSVTEIHCGEVDIWGYDSCGSSWNESYTVYIPEDSVVQSFVLDGG